MTTQTCKTCKKEKPLTDFNANKLTGLPTVSCSGCLSRMNQQSRNNKAIKNMLADNRRKEQEELKELIAEHIANGCATIQGEAILPEFTQDDYEESISFDYAKWDTSATYRPTAYKTK